MDDTTLRRMMDKIAKQIVKKNAKKMGAFEKNILSATQNILIETYKRLNSTGLSPPKSTVEVFYAATERRVAIMNDDKRYTELIRELTTQLAEKNGVAFIDALRDMKDDLIKYLNRQDVSEDTKKIVVPDRDIAVLDKLIAEAERKMKDEKE